MELEIAPINLYNRVLAAEQRRAFSGVNSLIKWWSKKHPETCNPDAFEIFSMDNNGRWVNKLSMGAMIFDDRDLTLGGGAIVFGDAVVVFTKVAVRDKWTSCASRMDGTFWFDTPANVSSWRKWSRESLLKLANSVEERHNPDRNGVLNAMVSMA